MNTFDQPPAARPMRAEYRGALRRELEAIVATPTRQRRWFRGKSVPWTHRAEVIAVAAAIVVVFFVPLPHVSLFNRLSQGRNGVSPGGSTTPKGWVPVTLGAAQIAVPSSWTALYDKPDCPMGKRSEVLVNPIHTICISPPPGDVPTNVIELYRYVPDKLREHLLVINGLRVYGTGGNWYDVPSLRIAMAIQGPLGRRVLNTLTRRPQGRNTTTTTMTKPLPVVDLSGIPAGWVPVAYGDVQISVPPDFWVYHQDACANFQTPGTVYVDPLYAEDCANLPPVRSPEITGVYIRPVHSVLGSLRDERSMVLNGLRMYALRLKGFVGFYVPAFGIEVTADGPMAQSVVNTITGSPRGWRLPLAPHRRSRRPGRR